MLVWVLFFIVIAICLALDLGVFHKDNTVVSMKDSLKWTAVWVTCALLFGVGIYYIYEYKLFDIATHHMDGMEAMTKYYTGYLLEESLSLDNIFVIALIFGYFKIEQKYQHRVLFWGILGAVVFRLIMILLGSALIAKFSWIMYVFGGILIFSALKMLKHEDNDNSNFQNSIGVRLLGKIYPIDWTINNGHFLEKVNGKTFATPLLASLVVVEFTDILFAVDSIPAIFSITDDPFIIFTSNIFAILGLRNLYFFLSGMLEKFSYIKYSLVFILLFVGLKMILHNHIPFIHEHSWISLVVILTALLTGILYSLVKNKANEKHV